MDKLAELNREYWGSIHDMCEGTDVKPWECVKHCGSKGNFKDHPKFVCDSKCYEFAVAILEDKPVFVANRIWCKINGQGFVIGDLVDDQLLLLSEKSERVIESHEINNFTLNPPEPSALIDGKYDPLRWAEGLIKQLPENHEGRNSWLLNHGHDNRKPEKRTFNLNGVELPCPVTSATAGARAYYIFGFEVLFENDEEADQVCQAFKNLLIDARRGN